MKVYDPTYAKKWRENHQNEIREYRIKYRKNPQKRQHKLEYMRKYNLDNRERRLKYAREHVNEYRENRRRTRLEVLKHYSPKLVCIKCGCDNANVLTIDHVKGGGRQQFIKIGKGIISGNRISFWLRKNKYPKGYQVLCKNCQRIKVNENEESNSSKNISLIKRKINHLQYLRYKHQAIIRYSPKKECMKCGFGDIRALEMDHIGGGGSKHLHRIGGNIYDWIRRNNYPSGFQVLCANCNWIKRLGGM